MTSTIQELLAGLTARLERLFATDGEKGGRNGKIKIDETSLHFALFEVMLASGIEPQEVITAYPHPLIKDAHIDVWMPDIDGGKLALELQYEPSPPKEAGQLEESPAFRLGQVLEGMRRMALLDGDESLRRILLLAAEPELAALLEKNRDLAPLISLKPGEAIHLEANIEKEPFSRFRPALGGSFSASFQLILSHPLTGQRHLYGWLIE